MRCERARLVDGNIQWEVMWTTTSVEAALYYARKAALTINVRLLDAQGNKVVL